MDLVARLEQLVGEAQVVTEPEAVAPYAQDWTRRWHGKPLAVVRPGSVEEVAAVVTACAEAGVPLVPQGGNTGLVGRGAPQDGEVVLSTRRLNAIGPVDAEARTVLVGAGVTLGDVQAAARAAGLDLVLDPAARESATVGGIVATNAGTRAQLCGLVAVRPDGSVVALPEGATDADDVFQGLPGSQGTRGVITAVRLLLAEPADVAGAALVAVQGVDDALAVLAAVRDRFDTVTAAEYLHDDGLRLVLQHRGLSSPFGRPYPLYLLLEVAGPEGAAVGSLGGLLGELDVVRDLALAGSPAERARVRDLLEAHADAVAAEGPAVVLDVALPPAALGAFEQRLPDVLRAVSRGAVPILSGHLAEGTLRVNLLHTGTDDAEGAVTDAVLHLVADLGGVGRAVPSA
ncbi:FAD-binding oxidoreductase [Spongisporangium articulatum]|uniref:FAD-binding oxidoreductase n=1 Tax=Spongisporangium articulatum TaxID=3362603 RepID=A0ABW8AHX2_9ACTN